MKVERIQGLPCVPFVTEDAVRRAVCDFVESGCTGYSAAINGEKMFRAKSNKALLGVIESAAFPVADGFMAVLALRLVRGIRAVKVDFPKCVFEAADGGGWRIALFGASCEVNSIAKQEITRKYPGIRVVAAMDGYQSISYAEELIRRTHPQVVFLALGSPKQELLAGAWTVNMPGALIVGCGGAFDVLAGKVSRAPSFFVNYGLEWLYRLFQNPSRWRRQLVLPVCLVHVLVEAVAVRMFRRGGQQ